MILCGKTMDDSRTTGFYSITEVEDYLYRAQRAMESAEKLEQLHDQAFQEDIICAWKRAFVLFTKGGDKENADYCVRMAKRCVSW